jgi:D-hydroxyproline dehydrogenase subunit gamma
MMICRHSEGAFVMPTDHQPIPLRPDLVCAAEAREQHWRPDPARPQTRLVTITIDGQPAHAPEGQVLAVALALLDRLELRHSPTAGTPRGMFCLMGSCQECLVHVDGVLLPACMEPVRVGMQVELDVLHRAHKAGA